MSLFGYLILISIENYIFFCCELFFVERGAGVKHLLSSGLTRCVLARACQYYAKLAMSIHSRQGSEDRLLESEFDHISKHLAARRQKYFGTRCIFNSFLDFWKS